MRECNGCGFGKIAYQGQLWCRPAHAFVKDLNGFCPQEMQIEEIKQRCLYYVPVAETDEEEAQCRASSHEHDHYGICWIESLDDLLLDPDFTLKT